MSLSLYLNDTAALLNDPNFTFTSKFQMTRFVNEARRTLAKETGCIRRLISGQSAYGAASQAGASIPNATQPGALPGAFPGGAVPYAVQNAFQTIPNVERYPYIGFFNPFLQAQHAGCSEVLDIIDLAVNWNGAFRPAMSWKPWDEFQAYCRVWTVLNTAFPMIWSVMNDGTMGEVWIFPIPSTYEELEADVFALPKDLRSDNDFDAIPDGFKEAVKFEAANLAFQATARYAQAEAMEQQFMRKVNTARISADRGKTSSYYQGW